MIEKPNRRQVLKTVGVSAASPTSIFKAVAGVSSDHRGNISDSLIYRRFLEFESYLNDRWLPNFARVSHLFVGTPTVATGRDSSGYLEFKVDGPPYIEAVLKTHGVETLSFMMPYRLEWIVERDSHFLKTFGESLKLYLDLHDFAVTADSVTVAKQSEKTGTRYYKRDGGKEVLKLWDDAEAIMAWENEGGAVLN